MVNMKKIISLILCLVLGISFATAVSAETVTASFEIMNGGNGIEVSQDASCHFVTILINKKTTLLSNLQGLDNECASSFRKFLYLDGKSVMDWIKKSGGDEYQVMVHFLAGDTPTQSKLSLWFDRSKPYLQFERDEMHTIEFKEGLLTSDGDTIAANKYLYTPETKKWVRVDNFDNIDFSGNVLKYKQQILLHPLNSLHLLHRCLQHLLRSHLQSLLQSLLSPHLHRSPLKISHLHLR